MLVRASSYSTPYGGGQGFWPREPANHGAALYLPDQTPALFVFGGLRSSRNICCGEFPTGVPSFFQPDDEQFSARDAQSLCLGVFTIARSEFPTLRLENTRATRSRAMGGTKVFNYQRSGRGRAFCLAASRWVQLARRHGAPERVAKQQLRQQLRHGCLGHAAAFEHGRRPRHPC